MIRLYGNAKASYEIAFCFSFLEGVGEGQSQKCLVSFNYMFLSPGRRVLKKSSRSHATLAVTVKIKDFSEFLRILFVTVLFPAMPEYGCKQ